MPQTTPVMELEKWAVFSLLTPDFMANIEFACVFGKYRYIHLLLMPI